MGAIGTEKHEVLTHVVVLDTIIFSFFFWFHVAISGFDSKCEGIGVSRELPEVDTAPALLSRGGVCCCFLFFFASISFVVFAFEFDPQDMENGRQGNLSHTFDSEGTRKKRMARSNANITNFSWISIFLSFNRCKKNV